MKPINYILKVTCACCFIILAASCHKPNQQSTPSFIKSDLPTVAVGSWWRYRVVDSLRNTADTLKLVVTSSSISGTTQTAKCNIEQNGLVTDTANFIISDTALYFDVPAVGANIPSIQSYYLKLPFSVGDNWNSSAGITDISSYIAGYQVLSNSYGAFYLKWNRDSPNDYHSKRFHFSKGIGLIDLRYDAASWGPFLASGSQQLIDYQLH